MHCGFISKKTWKYFLQQIEVTISKFFSAYWIEYRVNGKLKIIQKHKNCKFEFPIWYTLISNDSQRKPKKNVAKTDAENYSTQFSFFQSCNKVESKTFKLISLHFRTFVHCVYFFFECYKGDATTDEDNYKDGDIIAEVHSITHCCKKYSSLSFIRIT